MDKKIIVGIIAVIVIVSAIVTCLYFKENTKRVTMKEETDTTQYYGKRGNITELQRIKFLSKNDEYLVGMMGLPVSNEVKSFSNDEMIRFALNIAKERYAGMFDTRKNRNGLSQYVIEREIVYNIINEVFGVASNSIDGTKNEFYSNSNKAFLFNENLEKTLYYYPVIQESKDGGMVEITADAILVSSDDRNEIEQAKYEGKYSQDRVEYTIKFVFNENGSLVSYQYL